MQRHSATAGCRDATGTFLGFSDKNRKQPSPGGFDASKGTGQSSKYPSSDAYNLMNLICKSRDATGGYWSKHLVEQLQSPIKRRPGRMSQA